MATSDEQLSLNLGGSIGNDGDPVREIPLAEIQAGLARLARFREAERLTRGLPSDPKDAPHAVPGEMLSPPELAKGSYLAGRMPEPSSFANDPLKSSALMQSIAQNFSRMGSEYHYRDQPGKVAFTDGGERLDTKVNDGRVVAAMVDMAEAKGWPALKVTGSKAFKQAAWLEASLRGIEVKGFSPSAADLQQLADLQGTREASNKTVSAGVVPANSIERDEKQVAVDPKDVAKSLEDAKALIAKKLGESAKMYAAEPDSGKYNGAVIGNTAHHVVQQLSPRSAVVHDKRHFTTAHKDGDKLTIAYSNGRATIKQTAERVSADKAKGR
jgi:hypothetical protein